MGERMDALVKSVSLERRVARASSTAARALASSAMGALLSGLGGL
jgi:hypothetical protein